MTDAAVTPIIQPNNPFTSWHSTQIYDPNNPSADARYVPNVWDLIVDYTQGLFYVTSVDYTTGASTREKWNLPLAPPSGADEDDVLLGAGPGTIADSYRIFINQSLVPHTLSFDRRTRIYGTTSTNVKVFLGTDISDEGNVISQFYDSNWNLLGDNIPLELVAMNDATNFAVKTPKVGYTAANLNDGEILTAVVYDDVGTVVSTAKYLVQNSAFIRSNDESIKYITSISLNSPFVSPSDPTRLQWPINMPVANLTMMGVVGYSDGSTRTLPVDGTSFQLAGLEQYIATQEGQKIPLVLIYNLSQGEYSYVGSPSPNKTIAVPYSAVTLPTDGAYSVKMFVYPTWNAGTSQYDLRVFLYNLDRQDVYDVTSLYTADTDSNAFQPTTYNVVQNLRLAVNMQQVDASYKPFRFVQTVQVTLLRPGTDASGDNWTVAYTPGQTPQYGVSTKAAGTYIDVNNWQLDLTCGLTTLNDWLTRLYTSIQPLYDSQSESQAPTPNIMRVVVNGTPYEQQVSSWNQILTVSQAMTEGQAIYIEWIYRDGTNDLQLGISGLVVHLSGVPQV